MKAHDAFNRIFAGMRADVDDYRRLRDLLETQFIAAVHHRTDEIRRVGDDIMLLAVVFEGRRRERVELTRRLVPNAARISVATIAERLQGASRTAFDSCWTSLEAAVMECKALNMRNCRLLMDQYEIMQRVLNTGADTYAPA